MADADAARAGEGAAASPGGPTGDPLWDDWDTPPRVPTIPDLHLDGFDGPLDLLLDLAERQRIDLGRLSIAALATQFVAALDRLAGHVALQRRADWLVMVTRLVLLRSRLLFPASPEAAAEAERDAAAEARRLAEMGFLRAAAAWLSARPALGVDVFTRPAADCARDRLRRPDGGLPSRAARSGRPAGGRAGLPAGDPPTYGACPTPSPASAHCSRHTRKVGTWRGSCRRSRRWRTTRSRPGQRSPLLSSQAWSWPARGRVIWSNPTRSCPSCSARGPARPTTRRRPPEAVSDRSARTGCGKAVSGLATVSSPAAARAVRQPRTASLRPPAFFVMVALRPDLTPGLGPKGAQRREAVIAI
jgi:hypothetical protein